MNAGTLARATLVLCAGVVALGGAPACRRGQPRDARSASPQPGGALAEVKVLIDAGQLDEALAQLQAQPQSGESLYLQGLVFVRKAETAPLPTPPPLAPDAPRGAPAPRAPELKQEERQALDFFDQATRADAHFAPAPLAAAELLAPHALRVFDQQALGRRKHSARDASPQGADPGEWSVDAVLARYRQAVKAEARGTLAVEALLTFALRVGRLDEAEAGFRDLIKRDRESAKPLIRFGDFLREKRGEGLKAAEQYQQALIWEPQDQDTRAKLADVYLELGVEHFKKREYLAAQARFDEAGKYVKNPQSPQAQRLRDYAAQLREIRGGR